MPNDLSLDESIALLNDDGPSGMARHGIKVLAKCKTQGAFRFCFAKASKKGGSYNVRKGVWQKSSSRYNKLFFLLTNLSAALFCFSNCFYLNLM